MSDGNDYNSDSGEQDGDNSDLTILAWIRGALPFAHTDPEVG